MGIISIQSQNGQLYGIGNEVQRNVPFLRKLVRMIRPHGIILKKKDTSYDVRTDRVVDNINFIATQTIFQRIFQMKLSGKSYHDREKKGQLKRTADGARVGWSEVMKEGEK